MMAHLHEIGMNPGDIEEIHSAVQQWERAWNAGDMSGAAALFCDDADFVNVRGSHWHGRDQIVSEHTIRHGLQLKDSVFEPLHVGIQPITINTALVHVRWEIRDDRDLDGTPRAPRQGLFSWNMLHDGEGHWRIRAAHNFHVEAER